MLYSDDAEFDRCESALPNVSSMWRQNTGMEDGSGFRPRNDPVHV